MFQPCRNCPIFIIFSQFFFYIGVDTNETVIVIILKELKNPYLKMSVSKRCLLFVNLFILVGKSTQAAIAQQQPLQQKQPDDLVLIPSLFTQPTWSVKPSNTWQSTWSPPRWPGLMASPQPQQAWPPAYQNNPPWQPPIIEEGQQPQFQPPPFQPSPWPQYNNNPWHLSPDQVNTGPVQMVQSGAVDPGQMVQPGFANNPWNQVAENPGKFPSWAFHKLHRIYHGCK